MSGLGLRAAIRTSKKKEVWLSWCFPGVSHLISRVAQKIYKSSVLLFLVIKYCTRSFVFFPPSSSVRREWWAPLGFFIKTDTTIPGVSISCSRSLFQHAGLKDGRERQLKTMFMHTWKKPGGAQHRWASWQTLRQGRATTQSRLTKMIRYLDLNRENVTL